MSNNEQMSPLPMNTLSEIPTPNKDAKQIVALTKKGGVISGYKLSDDRILSKEEGVALAKQGGILGVGVAVRDGSEYLKSLPDSSDDNNLGNLPTVTEE